MEIHDCERCQGPGPTRYVQFHRHIGLIVVFLHGQEKGHFCRRCVGDSFTSTFVITLCAGWFGFISFIATPCVLAYDLAHYLLTVRSFRHEASTTSRVALSLAAAMAMLMSMGGAAMVALFLLVKWASSQPALAQDGYDDRHYAAYDEEARLRATCEEGAPYPGSPAFDPTDGLRVSVARFGVDRWSWEPGLVPGMDSSPDQSELVVCVGRQERVIEECADGTVRDGLRLDYRGTEAQTGIIQFSDSLGMSCDGPSSSASNTEIAARIAGEVDAVLATAER